MDDISELEKRSEIEFHKLGVAEELGWIIASLVAVIMYMKWESWWLTIGALLASYFFVTLPYRRNNDSAREAVLKASGANKYPNAYDRRDDEG
ncbi:hypothetical protein [Ramlibacter sp. 2FC]|uniref:hypothetical protein n=1 Tax=Ramlibacter sp. 2FC TaxID=2502188 RepID=UPI0010F7D942|nr:hypothetical protein [Ramlibacter sp. 2FC]